MIRVLSLLVETFNLILIRKFWEPYFLYISANFLSESSIKKIIKGIDVFVMSKKKDWYGKLS